MKKRLLLFVLTACMLLSCFACQGKKSAANTTDTGAEPDPTPSKLTAWATHSYDKLIVNVGPKGELSTDYTVYMTKGETESCTVAVRSDTEYKSTTLTLASGNTETIEAKMLSMDRSHSIGRKEYTDSLIPYNGKKLKLQADITLPFMLEFKTTKDTPAGDHKYVYEYKDKEGNVLATFNITVHVWDIVLPEEKTFQTAGGLYRSWIIWSGSGIDDEAYKRWYDSHIEDNISPYDLPYDILDSRADAYMSDNRVTSFMITVPENEDGSINEAKLLQYYEKVKSNPTWLKKAFFYPLDEPSTVEQLEELREWERKLGELCPEIDICAPYYTNIQTGVGTDQTDHMADYTTLWCPKLCLWDDVKSYDEFLDYAPGKSFEQRIAEQKAEGDRVWSYVCNDPDDPYAQLFIDTLGVNQRLMFWQMYQRGIDGFLYWGTNSYGFVEGTTGHTPQSPWETVNTHFTTADGTAIYGCGFLYYPGMKVGIPGCCSSIRAKIIRDGVDDVELFYLAEEYLGKDWLINKTKEGTPSLTKYVDNDTFAALRIEIGNALEAAMGN